MGGGPNEGPSLPFSLALPLPFRCNSIVSYKKNFKTSLPRKVDQRRSPRRAAVAEFEASGGASVKCATTAAAGTRSRSPHPNRCADFDRNGDRRVPFTQLDAGVAPGVSARNHQHRYHRDGDMTVEGGNHVCSNTPRTGGRRSERRTRGSSNHPTPGGDGNGEDDDDHDILKIPRNAENVSVEERGRLAADPHCCGRHNSETPAAKERMRSRERVAPGGTASQPLSLMVSSTDVRNRKGRGRVESESKYHNRRQDCAIASASVRCDLDSWTKNIAFGRDIACACPCRGQVKTPDRGGSP